jgi:hypothetical protein
MTSVLSVVSGRLSVVNAGVACRVLREVSSAALCRDAATNGWNPRLTAGNGGKAILKVGKNRRHSALTAEYSPKTGKKGPYIRLYSPIFASPGGGAGVEADQEHDAVRGPHPTRKANSGGRKSGFARFRSLKKARKFAIARIRSISSQGSFRPPPAPSHAPSARRRVRRGAEPSARVWARSPGRNSRSHGILFTAKASAIPTGASRLPRCARAGGFEKTDRGLR